MAYKDKLPILKNFVEMGITQDISSVDTTIYVTNASLFPALVPGADYIPCVIRWSGSTREVVHVVAVNTAANTITVERGKEGTAVQSWPSGSFLYATLTAQAQTDILNNIWIRCRASNGNAVAVTVESATAFSLPGDWREALEPMMALRILANGSFLSTENGIYIDSVSYTASTGKTLVSIRGASLPAKVAAIEHSLSSRAVSQSKEVQEYRNLVERVSANLNASEKTCIENADRAQAAAAKLTFSSAINSTKEDCAATPLAVKKAYDRGSDGITAANNALLEAEKKLPLSGGTLTGNVAFPVNDDADIKTLRFGVKTVNTDGSTGTFFPFRIIPGTAYGRGLVLSTGGPIILGGGESAQTFAKGHIEAGKLNGETEYTYITSDTSIEFYYGQNAGYDATKKIIISAAGDMSMPGKITASGGFKGKATGLGNKDFVDARVAGTPLWLLGLHSDGKLRPFNKEDIQAGNGISGQWNDGNAFWVKFSNGLIIQGNVAKFSSNTTVNLVIPFTSNLYAVYFVKLVDLSPNSNDGSPTLRDRKTTNFRAGIMGDNSTFLRECKWLAVGF